MIDLTRRRRDQLGGVSHSGLLRANLACRRTSGASYAQLAPHVLATAPLGDRSAASRQVVLATIRYLQAKGDSSSCLASCHKLLD